MTETERDYYFRAGMFAGLALGTVMGAYADWWLSLAMVVGTFAAVIWSLHRATRPVCDATGEGR